MTVEVEVEVEVELKLKVTREDVKVLAGLELIRKRCIATPTTQRLRTTYFDTPDEHLRRLRLELRVRRHGASFTQTLKTLSPSMAGLFKRGQWETPVSHVRPDLAALARLPDVDAGYRSVLGTPALAESLVPVFSSTMRRSIFPLCMADGS